MSNSSEISSVNEVLSDGRSAESVVVGIECVESSNDDAESKRSSDLTLAVHDKVEDGKNKHLVKCKFCPSKILSPGSATYHNVEFDLPEIGQKEQKSPSSETNRIISYEQLSHFWSVPDMYIFENIGFSNTVGQIKYLACADCEVGPIGYFDMNSKVSYVALARVVHDD